MLTFDFNSKTVRVIQLNGEPWFVAIDICQVLELGNVPQACSRLDDDEKNTITINDGIAGNPTKTIVSESGVYSLIFTSRKKEAKTFKRWVTHEVLPSLRKHGHYQIQTQPQETVPTWIIDRFDKLEKQINTLEESADQHKRHIKNLQLIIDEADQLWLTFPEPEAKIPTNSRQQVLLLIHHSVIKFRRPIAKIWEEAYSYFRHRSGFDAQARARNTGKAPLDLIFELGMGDAFYTACYELLVERYPTKYNK